MGDSENISSWFSFLSFPLSFVFFGFSIAERSVIGVLHQLDACVIREGSELLLGNTRRILEMQEERRLQKDCQLPSVRLSSAVDVKKIR